MTKIADNLKAKYVLEELTLGDVLDVVKKKVGALVVHQDNLTWDHIHFNWYKGKLHIYDGDENNDNKVALWTFSLKEKVRIKGNMVFFKEEDFAQHGTAIELLRTSRIDVGSLFNKSLK